VNLSGQERSATTTEDVLPFRHAPLAVQADFVNPSSPNSMGCVPEPFLEHRTGSGPQASSKPVVSEAFILIKGGERLAPSLPEPTAPLLRARADGPSRLAMKRATDLVEATRRRGYAP
jgi:hypothetical protein